jgi:hypothetical protein
MKDVSISTNTILTTKHQVLRYPKLNDTTKIFAVVKSPQFPEQLPRKEIYTVSEIEAWLSRLQEN